MKKIHVMIGCILAGTMCIAASPDEAMAKGAAFLLSRQAEDGHFSDPQMPALTALPLWALSGCAGSEKGKVKSEKGDEVKAANFVLGTQRPDGGFYVPKPGRGRFRPRRSTESATTTGRGSFRRSSSAPRSPFSSSLSAADPGDRT